MGDYYKLVGKQAVPCDMMVGAANMSVDQCSNKFTEWDDKHYSWKRDRQDVHYHNRREAFRAGWFAALETKERRKTVRRKPPVQQPQRKIAAIAKTCDRYAENCGLQSGMASAFNSIARQLRALR